MGTSYLGLQGTQHPATRQRKNHIHGLCSKAIKGVGVLICWPLSPSWFGEFLMMLLREIFTVSTRKVWFSSGFLVFRYTPRLPYQYKLQRGTSSAKTWNVCVSCTVLEDAAQACTPIATDAGCWSVRRKPHIEEKHEGCTNQSVQRPLSTVKRKISRGKCPS